MRLITKSNLMCPWLFLNMACAVQQQNGNGDIRLEPPHVLSDQQWKITQQLTTTNGDHVCTVSFGEMDITQRSHDHAVVQQVGTSNMLNPGDSYKVLVGEHNYESQQAWFDPMQSQAVIKDLMASHIAYTETRKITVGAGSTLRSIDNTIPMDDFAHQYQVCESFVKS